MPNTEAKRHSRRFVHVVAAIVRHPENPEKLFLTQRKKGQHLEFYWEFPGGKVEAGESRYQALKRELQEEIGIQIVAAHPFKSVRHQYKDKNIYLDVWEVKSYRGDPHGKEGQQAQWKALDKLGKLQFPEADMPILQALKLPQELLITPDMPAQHEDSYVHQFEQLMQKHHYPLIVFRSHHLKDDIYAGVADQLAACCQKGKSQIIIHRPGLKNLQHRLFKDYERRHLNSLILQSINSNPFEQGVRFSASCHDRDELKKAERLSSDFALLSTVRETPSHPGRSAKGWYGFNQILRKSILPVYALGGVRRRDLCVARLQGATGVAGISDFWTV